MDDCTNTTELFFLFLASRRSERLFSDISPTPYIIMRFSLPGEKGRIGKITNVME
jgi:hypothetical protein